MRKFRTFLCYVFLIICCVFTVFPLLFLLSLSIRDKQDIIKNGVMSLPKEFHFENYAEAWARGHFSTYFKNSVIISVISVLFVVLLATMIAYAMAYFDFKGKRLVNTLMLIGLIIPFEIVIIPLYYNMKAVGILGTRSSVYITQIALNIPISVFILTSFVKNVPTSLVESARMDGASEWVSMSRIIMPVIKPAEVSIIILIFMWTWNDFMLANIMLRNDSVRTLPLGLSYFKGKYARDNSMTAAASVIMMIPVLILYLVLQKQMIEGLTVGAVKE